MGRAVMQGKVGTVWSLVGPGVGGGGGLTAVALLSALLVAASRTRAGRTAAARSRHGGCLKPLR
jgi:hypothetical protein